MRWHIVDLGDVTVVRPVVVVAEVLFACVVVVALAGCAFPLLPGVWVLDFKENTVETTLTQPGPCPAVDRGHGPDSADWAPGGVARGYVQTLDIGAHPIVTDGSAGDAQIDGEDSPFFRPPSP